MDQIPVRSSNMRNTKNPPSRAKYHLSPQYSHFAGSGQRSARASIFSITALIVLLLPTLAAAQGTIMPPPIFTGLDGSGNPLVSGKLCTYVAGTSTPATTYATSALNPLATNTNPVILDGAGRATVFLRPGSSYKFVLYSAGSDQTCSTGTLQWSADNISALPTSNVNLDIDGTAGESLTAGDVVYLSDGSGSRTQGSWYKADADTAAFSSEAPFIGMAPSAISSGESGTIRIKGLVTVTGPLTAGAAYYVSGTAGGTTSTAPALIRNVGIGYTSTLMLLSPANGGKLPAVSSAYILNAVGISSIVNGRCSLTTGVPVTTADVTAATTLYWALYGGNQIGLYTGSVWAQTTLTQLSIAVPASTNQMYDVFVDYNDGTPQLSTTAWTNDTTRATALTTQDGIYVKTGDTQQRYVCSFRTTGVSGQTEDSLLKRYVWNYYNRVPRALRVLEATNSWTWTNAEWHQANASAANQVDVVVGVAEVPITLRVMGWTQNASTTGVSGVGIGEDSTSVLATGLIGGAVTNVTTLQHSVEASLVKFPAVGRHFYAWLEYGSGSSADTWFGDNGATIGQSGLSGWIDG